VVEFSCKHPVGPYIQPASLGGQEAKQKFAINVSKALIKRLVRKLPSNAAVLGKASSRPRPMGVW